MRQQATDDEGENAHDHVELVLDICTEHLYVSVECLACSGEIDGFEFLDGSAVVERRRLLEAYEAHEEYCPMRAIIEEADDEDEDGSLS